MKKTQYYRYCKRIFKYDFEDEVVTLVVKPTKRELKEEKEWREKHNSSLFNINEDGYMEIDSYGLRVYNWKSKAVRDEYLAEFIANIEEESAYLAEQFMKYEM